MKKRADDAKKKTNEEKLAKIRKVAVLENAMATADATSKGQRPSSDTSLVKVTRPVARRQIDLDDIYDFGSGQSNFAL